MNYVGIMVTRHVPGDDFAELRRLDGTLREHPSANFFMYTSGPDRSWVESRDRALFDSERFEPRRLTFHWKQLHGRFGVWYPDTGDLERDSQAVAGALMRAYMNYSVCGLRDDEGLRNSIAEEGRRTSEIDARMMRDQGLEWGVTPPMRKYAEGLGGERVDVTSLED